MKAIGLGILTYVIVSFLLSFIVVMMHGKKKIPLSIFAGIRWISFLVGLAVIFIKW